MSGYRLIAVQVVVSIRWGVGSVWISFYLNFASILVCCHAVRRLSFYSLEAVSRLRSIYQGYVDCSNIMAVRDFLLVSAF